MKIATAMYLVVTLLAPLASHADALSEDRVKELVLEAIRENPEIVLLGQFQKVFPIGQIRANPLRIGR